MARFGDGLIFAAAVAAIIWWVWRRFRHWLHEPPSSRLRRLARDGAPDEDDEAAALLREHGYEALSGKHRIPLGVSVDDGPYEATRLYFDYIASKEERYYLVKLERPRQPMDWTASGIRERLLVYALLFPECEGVIVADMRDRSLKTVKFKIEEGKE
ncbi:hypothetical protein SAMN05216312_104392 [Cohnella sp. OV330]|uniref:hypothetical protein n=1 Tax=Cohnella sp. OV330 TaxID=1855288 RepID=UPI0008EE8CE8|nr:hypothetical protein [Cohnella sp. OV330]SFB19998.1 hypothetical protein SAMN05216312_104392 [Cohnella sp. OV330]